jgi:hypothetical protein
MRTYTKIKRFNSPILEKKGELKKLVGKDEDEELTVNDAKRLGNKIAAMDGENKRKYVGIMNFLGASCNIYTTMWKNYKRTRDRLDKGK